MLLSNDCLSFDKAIWQIQMFSKPKTFSLYYEFQQVNRQNKCNVTMFTEAERYRYSNTLLEGVYI